ncbi:MAG TPA: hypothetical protein PK894_06990 [Defluviitoga sp.]|nr:hypothetical protein [Defluviitoga sp.]HOP24607.1 hypothetical protein [Defluviitoga sp.]HPZ29415.1 hypothetical protein [Defluviitoga sp.]HQD63322.1 hypothetical protein [Defluviitoga sp.]
MKSYIKYFNELKSVYQNQLDLTKKLGEIPEVFSRNVSKLLEMIYGEDKVDAKVFAQYVEFVPDQEPYYRLKQELLDFLGEDWQNSDLPSIIAKMAKSAYNRYKRIMDDHDRTETFRLG